VPEPFIYATAANTKYKNRQGTGTGISNKIEFYAFYLLLKPLSLWIFNKIFNVDFLVSISHPGQIYTLLKNYKKFLNQRSICAILLRYNQRSG
jgi:hypothetical protein